jgi:hypothetical protein
MKFFIHSPYEKIFKTKLKAVVKLKTVERELMLRRLLSNLVMEIFKFVISTIAMVFDTILTYDCFLGLFLRSYNYSSSVGHVKWSLS